MTKPLSIGARVRCVFAIGIVFLLCASPAYAYIGPGAGFAFLSSFLVLFATFALAFLTLITWPIRFLFRLLFRKDPYKNASVDRVVVVGLDGLDPELTKRFMEEGKLPNFSRLAEQGGFSPLRTTCPAMSPVAWSSFQTGVNPGKHNIFDFLTRDEKTYLPVLSSSVIGSPKRALNLGKYQIPVGKPELRLMRKSKPFWCLLDERNIFSSILRIPITFPPEKFNGVSLSAMCVPDLRGSQGTFSFYSSGNGEGGKHTGGVQIPVKADGNTIKTHISGPPNFLLRDGEEEMTIPISIRVKGEEEVEVTLPDQKFNLKRGEYSEWITVTFKPGLWFSVTGICRFLLRSVKPEFQMYVTPINLDPENPAMPISNPLVYSVYLSKLQGKYATLGLAEDTWALNERVIDEDAFLAQAYTYHQEREEMFFNALEKTPKGVCACVFDATDRIQHTFWRYLEQDHPANRDKDNEKHKDAIEQLYTRMDDLIGRVMEKIDYKTLLFVMSDHGFCSFRRGVNINSWLHQNGYLALKEGLTESEDYFQGVDWSKTKAFTLGLTGIFLNIKGRESQGIVEPGEEEQALKEELLEKLQGLMDEQTGEVAVREVFDAKKMLSGPYARNAPDILFGYNRGYRASWEAAVARVTDSVFTDNTKSWSGDHCVDHRLIPGVLFCNRAIDVEDPSIMDLAPTILQVFGVERPGYMDGTPLLKS